MIRGKLYRYKKIKLQFSQIGEMIFIVFVISLFFSITAEAQSNLQGQIQMTINNLVRLLNIVIVGFTAWAGFLIAKGDRSGQARLIYSIVGLVVVNTANLIINYFI